MENFRITLVQYTVLNYKQKRKQQNACWPKESDDSANILLKLEACTRIVKIIETGNQNQKKRREGREGGRERERHQYSTILTEPKVD